MRHSDVALLPLSAREVSVETCWGAETPSPVSSNDEPSSPLRRPSGEPGLLSPPSCDQVGFPFLSWSSVRGSQLKWKV